MNLMVMDIIDVIPRNAITIIAVLGGLCTIIFSLIEISRSLRPKLEINISLPSSAYNLVPILEGINTIDFDKEKIASMIQSDISKEGLSNKISGIIRTISDNCIYDPRNIKLTIEVNNIGKRSVNLISFGFKIQTDVITNKKIEEWEISQILQENNIYTRDITIKYLLMMLKPFKNESTDKIKILFYFKDSKGRLYNKHYTFNYFDWELSISKYDKLIKDIKIFDTNLVNLIEGLKELLNAVKIALESKRENNIKKEIIHS
jgi:hypothetical protein